MKELIYTGAFRDLIPKGYQFQYMYAANYKCYNTCYIGNNLKFWIWVKGRDIEINDWNGLEVPIIQYVKTHPFSPKKKKIKNHTYFDKCFHLMCNRKTMEIHEKVFKKDDPIFLAMTMKVEQHKSQKEIDAFLKNHYEIWREISFDPEELLSKLNQISYEIREDIS